MSEARFAVATFVYLAHADGHTPDDADLAAHCAAVAAAEDAGAGDAAGEALVSRVEALLADADVATVLGQLFGESLRTDLGEGSRDDRLHRIRAYQFSRGQPWLATIYERREDGTVAPSTVLVERVTDLVRVMDPNPWDDVPEDRALPTGDFLVLWELAGCPGYAIA